MHDYTLAHLSDEALLRNLAALVVRDRVTTAALLAHIAEVDARRLYVPAGYSSSARLLRRRASLVRRRSL